MQEKTPRKKTDSYSTKKKSKRWQPHRFDNYNRCLVYEYESNNARKITRKPREGGSRQTTEGGSPNDTKQEHLEQEHKEQQQQAAAVFSQEKTVLKYQTPQAPKAPVVKIYSELENIDIPESDKIEISKRYKQEIVKKAIEWAIHPKTKLNKGLAPAIKWACQNEPELPKEKKDVVKENRNLCKKLDGLKNEFVEVTVLQNYIEFTYLKSQKAPSVLVFSENGFKEKLDSLMRKCKFL